MFFIRRSLLAICFLSTAVASAKIQDNSFLIEEAYNQEPGVVQFINGYQFSDLSNDWTYTFTNEMPIGDETHQFSYVIPVSKVSGTPDETGIGDILLNYRYQALSNQQMTVTPRLSLIVPTGDYKKGLGNGAVGLQFNQAVSITLNDKWTNHWNAGFTFVPDGKNANDDKANLFGFNFGTSAIYDLTDSTNLLCEFVYNSMDSVDSNGSKMNGATYYVVPGFRTAFKAGQDTEIVPGLAALLGVGPSADEHDRGLFAYLSIESKLW